MSKQLENRVIQEQHELTHEAKMHLNILLSKVTLPAGQEMLIVLVLLSNVLSKNDLSLWVFNCKYCVDLNAVKFNPYTNEAICYSGFEWGTSLQGHSYWGSALAYNLD